jgi:succinate dehydrogenase / fumarate reductase iron-sulfur subunit
MSEKKMIHFRVKRQNDREQGSYWEEFSVPYRPGMNVISALMEVQRNPVNAKGEKVRSVVWEYNCLEEVCGACSMVINGNVRQACSALVDKLEQPIQLEPMKTFPVEKDLVVDRSRLFESLKSVNAWLPIDGTYPLDSGPKIAPEAQQEAYAFSTCMTCGCCLEACPNVNDHSPYLGAMAMAQAHYFNLHPTGKMQKDKRLDAATGDGGIHNCGNSQNCVEVCPKEIPLTAALASLNKDTNFHAWKRWLHL